LDAKITHIRGKRVERAAKALGYGNTHPGASTVLAVPLSTALNDFPLHIRLQPGETGLQEISELQPENISVITKDSLIPNPW
jgi:mRNA-degrading endonuclease toxin of MazEF toxin-antitoxin module